MNCYVRYTRYTDIPSTPTPKILLQTVTAYDINSDTVFLIKNAEEM